MGRRLSGLAACAFVAAACAASNAHIQAPYAASAQPPQGAPAHVVVWRGLHFRPTDPGRPNRVGIKKNGYGWETADIFLDPEPRTWMADAARRELAAAGVQVAEAPLEGAPGISIEVRQSFVEPQMSFWSLELIAVQWLTVRIVQPDGTAYERRFVGEYTRSDLFLADRDLERAFQESTRAAMSSAARAARALLDELAARPREPGRGA